MIISRAFAAFGALVCAISVALGAYASHVATGQAKERMALAALFAVAHGLALIALATRESRLALLAKSAFALAIVLFSGSLALAACCGTATTLAPFGGSLLMLGWTILAADFLRTP